MEDVMSVDSICVEVMSRISASISHELKNTLAIINENAGLLDDLLIMADDDEGLGREHIQVATTAIAKQVTRGNNIIKNFNVFAHSGDTPLGDAYLSDVLQLVVNLSDRQAAMKITSVELSCDPEIKIRTYLLVFESLLYLTIISFIDEIPVKSRLNITAERIGNEVTIRFSCDSLPESQLINYFVKDLQPIVTSLGGSIVSDANDCLVMVPDKSSASTTEVD